ncbi:MAG: hypothetical protein LR015_02655 [Verrucomicrobia bacterium]|nr:hypothetical protein [Verrucomicrobiota bacterium]
MQPVLGPDGGDLVPLALRNEMGTPIPPRWWKDLINLLNAIPQYPWGTEGYPILFASSNYGIDSMYALSKNPTLEAQKSWANAGLVLEQVKGALNWGPCCSSFSHACVSAHLAAVQGEKLLRAKVAKKVLLVAFDYLGPFVTAGFKALKILNNGMPSPYMNSEMGSIGLGDGAAWAILGTDKTSWEIAGSSVWNEMYHFTANEPEGSGFSESLRPFFKSFQNQRFWVKGHGTGTLEAGKLECLSVAKHFPGTPLVSWKGSIGHTLGSCALVEAVIAIRAQEQGRIPATIGTRHPLFADCVATDNFDAGAFNSILMLCNAFGGAHGGWLLHYEP